MFRLALSTIEQQICNQNTAHFEAYSLTVSYCASKFFCFLNKTTKSQKRKKVGAKCSALQITSSLHCSKTEQ